MSTTARALIEALAQRGLVIVPREPTPGMLAAGRASDPTPDQPEDYKAIWQAMIAEFNG